MERVMRLASQKPVVIFSKSSCCISHTVKSLFSNLGVNAAVHEIDQLERGKELEKALSKKGCNPAIPAVFIGGELVGGATEVMARHLDGNLDQMLIQVGAKWL